MAISVQQLNVHSSNNLPVFSSCPKEQVLKHQDFRSLCWSSCSKYACDFGGYLGTRRPLMFRCVSADMCSMWRVMVTNPVITGKMKDVLSVSCKAQAESSSAVSEAEKEGWKKRQDEAGIESDDGSWQWSLNWNHITANIIVGSCPRSPKNVDRMVDAAGVTAILNLQSNLCFDALKIPFEDIRKRAVERGVYLERVAVRDFDHGDQALMLPQAVRTLNLLLARGFKVYVHCTAGINRATLTVVGYLTFVQGMDLDDAVSMVKSARKVAHPYIDCWVEVKRRLLDGRGEELTAVSKQIYEMRQNKSTPGNSSSDWEAAQKQVIASTFGRWLEVDLGILQMEHDQLDRQYAATLQKVKADFEAVFEQAHVNRNNSGFSLAKYVADTSTNEEVPETGMECDVITHECASPEE